MDTVYLNKITRRLTTFDSFADLVAAGNNYRPSIHLKKHDIENRFKIDLANAYDDWQRIRCDERRAYRTRD
jgi:hypothetical protein